MLLIFSPLSVAFTSTGLILYSIAFIGPGYVVLSIAFIRTGLVLLSIAFIRTGLVLLSTTFIFTGLVLLFIVFIRTRLVLLSNAFICTGLVLLSCHGAELGQAPGGTPGRFSTGDGVTSCHGSRRTKERWCATAWRTATVGRRTTDEARRRGRPRPAEGDEMDATAW